MTKISFFIVSMVVVVLSSVVGCGGPEGPQPQRLSTVEIRVGERTLDVEVAATDEERRIGMMYRKHLAPDEGMLFVFSTPRTLSFYMKNTLAPLSIAFLRADGVILNIEDMERQTLVTHNSRLPCRMALEMPQGWFERNGLKEGDRIGLPDTLPVADN